jgi:hypothetical protein
MLLLFWAETTAIMTVDVVYTIVISPMRSRTYIHQAVRRVTS